MPKSRPRSKPNPGPAIAPAVLENSAHQPNEFDALFAAAKSLLDCFVDPSRSERLFPGGIDHAQIVLAARDRKLELSLSGHTKSRPVGDLTAEGMGFGAESLTQAAFVLLPQVSGNGYYSYSQASNQYGTTPTINAVVDIGKQWQFNSQSPFGVGDISLEQGGPMPGHTTGHQLGRNVDVRPIRGDGQQAPVTWQDAAYSRAQTQLLVDNFLAHANCSKIYFNDPQIQGVQPLAGHDNHLHIEMKS